MKNIIFSTTRGITASIIAFTMLLTSACTKSDVAVTFTVTGNASGSQTTPASNSNGSGTFNGKYNQETNVLTYTSVWSNLTGAPTTAAFYVGAVGQSGASFSNWALGSGLSVSGSLSGSVVLNADQEAALLAGNCYYLISTTANVSGEVRGQLTATR